MSRATRGAVQALRVAGAVQTSMVFDGTRQCATGLGILAGTGTGTGLL